MKFVKFSVLALALGFFAVSCNNDSTTTESTTTDTTATMAPAAPVTEPAPAAPMTTDSAATMAPAAGTNMDTMHTSTTTTETKAK